MDKLLNTGMILAIIVIAAVFLFFGIRALRQRQWSQAAMVLLLPLVVFGGIAMAASGASPGAFMGLVFLLVGAALVAIVVKYKKNPTYVDNEGKEQKAGPAMLALMGLLAAASFAGAGFILTHLDLFAG